VFPMQAAGAVLQGAFQRHWNVPDYGAVMSAGLSGW
jgi:hypothetical protein